MEASREVRGSGSAERDGPIRGTKEGIERWREKDNYQKVAGKGKERWEERKREERVLAKMKLPAVLVI